MTLAVSGTMHAQEPTLKLTVASFDQLIEDAKAVASAVVPGLGAAMVDGFAVKMGVADGGIDTSAPWVVEMWLEGAEPEAAAIRFPVEDQSAFKSAVSNGALLGGEPFDQGTLQYGDGFATLVMGETPRPTTAAEAVDDTIRLDFHMTEAVREMVLAGLDEASGEVENSMDELREAEIQGMNPAAIVDLMTFYFEVIETGVQGLDVISYALSADSEALVLNQEVATVADSVLANLLSAPSAPVADLVAYSDPGADMTFAGSLGDNDAIMDFFMEYMSHGFAIMGMNDDAAPMMEKMQEWMESLIPVSFAVSYDFGEGMAFDAVYGLQGRDAAGLTETFLEASQAMIDAQSESMKLYKQLTFNPVDIEGVDLPVTRVSLEMDLDNPVFGGGDPVAADFMDSFFPGGAFTYDMVASEDRMFLATEGRVKRLLDVDAGAVDAPRLLDGATGYARVNILGLMADVMALNPAIPEEVRGIFTGLDREGTEITISAAPTETGARSRTSIPFAMIQKAGLFFMGVQQTSRVESPEAVELETIEPETEPQ